MKGQAIASCRAPTAVEPLRTDSPDKDIFIEEAPKWMDPLFWRRYEWRRKWDVGVVLISTEMTRIPLAWKFHFPCTNKFLEN